MKKGLIILAVVVCSIANITAQQGYKALTVSSGYAWGIGSDTYISLDMPNNHFNSFEFFGNIMLSEKEDNYIVGVAYNKSLSKGINSVLRLKMGLGAGTTTSKAVFSGIVGFEYIYAVSRKLDFMVKPQGGYFLKSDYSWRFSSLIGIRYNF